MSRAGTRPARFRASTAAANVGGKTPATRSVESALEALKHGYRTPRSGYLDQPICSRCARPDCIGVEHNLHARVGYAVSALESALRELDRGAGSATSRPSRR